MWFVCVLCLLVPVTLFAAEAREEQKATASNSATATRPAAERPLPTGEQVLDRYVEVTGGREKYLAIRTLVSRYRYTDSESESIGVEYREAPDRYCLVSTTADGWRYAAGVNSEIAWEIWSGSEASIISGEWRNNWLRESRLNAEVNWRDLFKEARCVGMVEFEGTDCYKVVLTPREGADEIRYYDVATGLLKGRDLSEGRSESSSRYWRYVLSDYRDCGGILRPGLILEGDLGRAPTYNTRLLDCQSNAEIPAGTFELPAAVEALVAQPVTTTQPASAEAEVEGVDTANAAATRPAAERALPTGEQVLDRYVEATGGREKYLALNTLVSRYHLTFRRGESTCVEYMAAPDQYFSVSRRSDGVRYAEGVHDGIVWEIWSGRKARIVSEELGNIRLREYRLNAEVNWRDLFKEARCVGVVTFEGADCYKVVLTPREGADEIRYYDVATGLLKGRDMPATNPDSSHKYRREVQSDYRDCGGILRPGLVLLGDPGRAPAVVIRLLDCQNNADISAGTFELPAAIKALLAQPVATTPAAAQPG